MSTAAHTALIIENARLVHTAGAQPHTDAHSSTIYVMNGQIAGLNQKPADFPEHAERLDARNQLTSFALADLAVRLSEKGGNYRFEKDGDEVKLLAQ